MYACDNAYIPTYIKLRMIIMYCIRCVMSSCVRTTSHLYCDDNNNIFIAQNKKKNKSEKNEKKKIQKKKYFHI